MAEPTRICSVHIHHFRLTEILGLLEMLVQYQDDRILFLPALPKEWKDGKIRGLKAPGGITIDFAWKDGRITECSLKSLTDTVRTLLYNGTEKEITLKAD